MARTCLKGRRPAPAVIDLDAELADLSARTIGQLRDLWRRRRGQEPSAAFSKELIARALGHWRQEEVLGGLSPRLRMLLAASGKDRVPARHVKVGSVIVREHQGELHEVLVVPDGFCWRGKTFASLSIIARKITGTSWNGLRFFGLRSAEAPADSPSGEEVVNAKPFARSGSVRARPRAFTDGSAP